MQMVQQQDKEDGIKSDESSVIKLRCKIKSFQAVSEHIDVMKQRRLLRKG
jgi:hypothetical protein